MLSAIPPAKHHQWFRSMASSQALAQSVFANLKWHGKLGLLADLRGEDGLQPFPPGVVRPRDTPAPLPSLSWSMTSTTWAEPRPTSVDVMFDGDYRVAVECKLSEPEVRRRSRPGPDAIRLELRDRSLRWHLYPPARPPRALRADGAGHRVLAVHPSSSPGRPVPICGLAPCAPPTSSCATSSRRVCAPTVTWIRRAMRCCSTTHATPSSPGRAKAIWRGRPSAAH